MSKPVLMQIDPVCLGIPDDPDDNAVRRLLDFMQQASNEVSMLRWLDSPFPFATTHMSSATTCVTIQFYSS